MSATCKNCAAPLAGRYCSNCGQIADVHVPSTKELVHEVLEGLTHSDSRLWRTLRCLWLKPGRLTREFSAGRRATYLPPFRLYLILSVAFFLLLSFTHIQGQVVAVNDANLRDLSAGKTPTSITVGDCDKAGIFGLHFNAAMEARIRAACKATVADNAKGMMHGAVALFSKAMFVLLPLVAALHMLLYWHPRHRYAEHLVFFLHLHAFFFCIAILLLLLELSSDAWPGIAPAVQALLFLAQLALPIYTVVAMREVFQRSWPRTLLKGVALGCIYLFMTALFVPLVFTAAFLAQ